MLQVFSKFVIWCCENGSYVEGSRVWSERAPICNDDVGDDSFLIDNLVFWSIALICFCVLHASVSYHLFCRWSRREEVREDGEEGERSVVLIEGEF